VFPRPRLPTAVVFPLRRRSSARVHRTQGRSGDIKARLAQFLREDLKLDLSPDKTLITHARTGAARFLGYEITVHHADHKLTNGRRSVNGKVALRVPWDVITAKSAPFMKLGKPERRPDLLNLTDNQIVGKFGAEWRGYLQYYLLAQDVWRLNRLQWVMLTSMLKTLAGKHRATVTAMAASIRPPSPPRTGHGCASRPASNARANHHW